MFKSGKCSKSEIIMRAVSISVISLTAAGMTANAYAIGPWDPLLENYQYQSHGVLSMESPSHSVYIDTDDIYENADRIKELSTLFPGLLEDDKLVYLEDQKTYVVEHADGTITYLGAVGDATPYDVEEGYSFSSLHATLPLPGTAGIDITAEEGTGLRNLDNNIDAAARSKAKTDGKIETAEAGKIINDTTVVNFPTPTDNYNIAATNTGDQYNVSVGINGTLEFPEGYYDHDVYVYNNVINKSSYETQELRAVKYYHLHSTISDDEKTNSFATAYRNNLADDYVRTAVYDKDANFLGYTAGRNIYVDPDSTTYSKEVYDASGTSLGFMNEDDIHIWVSVYDSDSNSLGYILKELIHKEQNGSSYPMQVFDVTGKSLGYVAESNIKDSMELYTVEVFDDSGVSLGHTYSQAIHSKQTISHYDVEIFDEDGNKLGYTSNGFIINDYTASKIYTKKDETDEYEFAGYSSKNGYLSATEGGCYTKAIYTKDGDNYVFRGYAAACGHTSSDVVNDIKHTSTAGQGYYTNATANADSVTLLGLPKDDEGATEYVTSVIKTRHVHSTTSKNATTTDLSIIAGNKKEEGSDGYISSVSGGCYTKQVTDATGNVVGYACDCGYYAGEIVKMELTYSAVKP